MALRAALMLAFVADTLSITVMDRVERRAGGFRTVDVEGERPPEPATAG